jgi:hypothetical protein
MPLRHAAAAMYVTQETTADSIASSSRWSLAFKLSYSKQEQRAHRQRSPKAAAVKLQQTKAPGRHQCYRHNGCD